MTTSTFPIQENELWTSFSERGKFWKIRESDLQQLAQITPTQVKTPRQIINALEKSSWHVKLHQDGFWHIYQKNGDAAS